MRFLLLNQTFHPDVVATSQYLTDFALGAAERGHEVWVVSSRRGYDNPTRVFPARESWNGIQIRRIRSSALGKSAKWKRAIDFGTFLLSCIGRLMSVPKPDVVVALTSPPLISFIGALYARLRGARFVYWVMDLNPDEAVAAGWLRPHSFLTRVLEALSRFSFRQASVIIALDRFMAERIAAKLPLPRCGERGASEELLVEQKVTEVTKEGKLSIERGGQSSERPPLACPSPEVTRHSPPIHIIPPWSHDDVIQFDAAARDQFRREHGLNDKFVVMYSGNHSPCHSLATLLEAARALIAEESIVFLFVGGGSEWPKVQEFARNHSLNNVRCLPYQPLDQLAGSLSAADLHVVVMGDAFVGTIHPCKIYNILAVEAPILYIGPAESHVTEIFGSLEAARSQGNKDRGKLAHGTWYEARHGEVGRVTDNIRNAAARAVRGDPGIYSTVSAQFSKQVLLPRQIKAIEAKVRIPTTASSQTE